MDAEHVKDREASNHIVAEMIRGATNRKVAMGLMALLALMLERDALPAAGRSYLAGRLKVMAQGRDPFPRKPTKPSRSKLDVLVAIAREAQKRNEGRGATRGDLTNVYETIAGRLDISKVVTEKYASTARKGLRASLANNVAAGVDREEVIAAIGRLYRLKPEAVKSYLL